MDWSSVLAVVGPTGSGKSALALDLAEALGGEILGLDSVQLYRGFDIGSAKPTLAERSTVPHHLVDVFDWHQDCNAQDYARLARQVVEELSARGKPAVFAGGTGLYLRALTQDRFHDDLPQDEALRASLKARPLAELFEELQRLDPVRAAEIHPNDRFRVVRSLELRLLLGRPIAETRPPPRAENSQGGVPFLIYLEPPRAALHARIEARTRAMLASGLVDEVRALLAQGVAEDAKPMQSIGYAEVCAMLRGKVAAADLAGLISASTRQYAKRQCTWFRKVKADLRLESGGGDAAPQALAAFRARKA